MTRIRGGKVLLLKGRHSRMKKPFLSLIHFRKFSTCGRGGSHVCDVRLLFEVSKETFKITDENMLKVVVDSWVVRNLVSESKETLKLRIKNNLPATEKFQQLPN